MTAVSSSRASAAKCLCAEAVVVVHGVWMPGTETILLRRRLDARGFHCHLFRYHSLTADLDENATHLARFVEDVPGDTVHFVGHSLGGVVILWMLQCNAPRRLGRVVCLGAPLNGSATARTLGAHPGTRAAVGKSLAELTVLGGLSAWTGESPLGIIAGEASLGVGKLVARLPRPNDGTVSVEETRLPGATDHIVVPASHMSLLWSKPVADHVARFLVHGRFQRERD